MTGGVQTGWMIYSQNTNLKLAVDNTGIYLFDDSTNKGASMLVGASGADAGKLKDNTMAAWPF